MDTPSSPSRVQCDALIQELREWQATHGPGCEECARLVVQDRDKIRAVPLVHGVGGEKPGDTGLDRFVRMLAEFKLLSKRGQGSRKAHHPTEQKLSIEDRSYTAAGFLYPEKHFAFVFEPVVEVPHDAEASPWDTGKFMGSFCSHLSEAQKVEAYRRYTLPAPEYREYLIEHVASFFAGGLEDYLAGRRPPAYVPGPLGVIDRRQPLSWIFEVRLKSPVSLESPQLAAVFVSPGAGGPAFVKIERALKKWRASRVEVIELRAGEADIQRAVERWLRERVGKGTTRA